MRRRFCLQFTGAPEHVAVSTLLEKLTGCRAGETVSEEAAFNAAGHKASVHLQKTRYRRDKKTDKLTVTLREGTLFYSGRLVLISEVVVKYRAGQADEARKFAAGLLAKYPAVLAEPVLKQRVAMEGGFYDITRLPQYDKNDLRTVFACHFPWQLYSINKSWVDFLQKPEDRPGLRRLRVKIRRLRSYLTFFAPLFAGERLLYWQREFKKDFAALGRLREIDVALMNCENISSAAAGGQTDKISALADEFAKDRQRAAAAFAGSAYLSSATLKLLDFYLLLQNAAVPERYAGQGVDAFITRRILSWSRQLAKVSLQKYSLGDIEKLHRVRVRLKKLRYVSQFLPELPRDANLLHQTKKLQDLLGFLHDDYVNGRLTEKILKKQKQHALQSGADIFTAWDKSKAGTAFALLPDLWEDFCLALNEWNRLVKKKKQGA